MKAQTNKIAPTPVAVVSKTREGNIVFRFGFQDYALMSEEAQERLRELALYDSGKRAWVTTEQATARAVSNLLRRERFTLIFKDKLKKDPEERQRKLSLAKRRLKALQKKPWLAFVKPVKVTPAGTFAEEGEEGKKLIVFRVEVTPGHILHLGKAKVIKSKHGKEYTYYVATKRAIRALCEKHPELVRRRKKEVEEKLKRLIEEFEKAEHVRTKCNKN